ncbi:hypothetical protein L0156_27915 [bacterium]|nr:hypothetical protein [bacterium]
MKRKIHRSKKSLPKSQTAKRREATSTKLDRCVADAILGIDTLWGGDVMNPSGMGRFLADCWFSDEPLPRAYTHPAAARLRETGGVSAKQPDHDTIHQYLDSVDIPGAIKTIAGEATRIGGMRGKYLEGLSLSLKVMWNLIQEILGKGAPVPYSECVLASIGISPEPSQPDEKRRRLKELLKSSGFDVSQNLMTAVDAWRAARLAPSRSAKMIADAFIAQLDALTVKNMLPYMPARLRTVPRSNIEFLLIENARFSGSMNYIGRARTSNNRSLYDATYEMNASLQISIPEFIHQVSHEVVPGHVTTYAYIQDLYIHGKVGFEATVQTMNTLSASLFEGIANNAILIAYGVKEVEELPSVDLQIGVLLSTLQDDGKNQSSYLTWQEKLPQKEVADTIRRDFLLSEERADKLSGAWGRHPLLGRMCLPAYRAGTELIAQARRKFDPEKILPLIYSCNGLMDLSILREIVK